MGTPQGSRLSPILFLCLMADLDLHINKSFLTNFADDTQSIVISDTKEDAEVVLRQEANAVIQFFTNNNLDKMSYQNRKNYGNSNILLPIK